MDPFLPTGLAGAPHTADDGVDFEQGSLSFPPPGSTADEAVAQKAHQEIRVLVVDDDLTLRDTCATVLRQQGFPVSVAGRGEEALVQVRRGTFDIILLDLYMSGVSGMDLLKESLERNPHSIVVMMTGNPSVASNVAALEQGAWDYLPKPFSATHLELVVGRAVHVVLEERKAREVEAAVEREHGNGGPLPVLGSAAAFLAAIHLASRVARSAASVFITGESGTGKELIAQFIHHNSRRSGKPLVTVNCAALPEPLLESEMFGHYKGAFTGALRDKPGLFETANGGTLFLDEVTEMSQAIQAKLLRVLQDGKVRRVGSNRVDAEVDVRIIAATNRNPGEAVREGTLRSDLYYRLRVVPIQVPPLRERQEDVPVLANYFLRKYWTRDHGRKPVPRFSETALRALQSHPWPGNVRELQNLVEHTVVMLEPGITVQAPDLPFMQHDAVETAASAPSARRYWSQPYHEARDRIISDFEQEYVRSLVARAGGNMSRAARIAGVDRTTLYRLIQKHDLEREIVLRSKHSLQQQDVDL